MTGPKPIVLAILAALAAGPVAAQAVCMPRADLETYLTDRYGETVRMSGLVGDSAMIEVWGADSGTWTITRTLSTGLSSVLAAGQAFETHAAGPDGDAL
jgi:hypothetical protein